MKLLFFLALSISSYVLGPFGLGLGHGPIWPLTFLAKLALHNTTTARKAYCAKYPAHIKKGQIVIIEKQELTFNMIMNERQ